MRSSNGADSSQSTLCPGCHVSPPSNERCMTIFALEWHSAWPIDARLA